MAKKSKKRSAKKASGKKSSSKRSALKKTAPKKTAGKKKSAPRRSARKPAARAAKAAARTPALRIHCVVHEVANLDQASAGYTELLGAPGRRIEQGGGRHFFDLGDAVLSLLDVSQGGMTPRTSGSDLYLSVPSLATYHGRASTLGWLSKADIHGGPAGEIVERPWRERSFYVEDPWGNGICFVEAGTEFTGKMG
jgi:catechol 2,3-dioxygenase-like lactoylglutathione lyase family enzyme